MFDEKTIQYLKSYVYLLINPATKEPFYVGKGKGNRVFNHVNCALDKAFESDKYDEIRNIQSQGLKVEHLIIRHGLQDKTAFEIESALLDTFKYIPKLKSFIRGNIQGGVNSIEKGLMSSEEIIRLYNAEPLNEIRSDAVIININGSYKRGAQGDAIYNATKGVWKMDGHRLNSINYVLSEYRGLIVEVFEIEQWLPEKRPYGPTAKRAGQFYEGYKFEGKIASDEIRNIYINKSIAHKKKKGSANVVRYTL
jgi:hypothetical protein